MKHFGMEKSKLKPYKKPQIEVYRTSVTLMENYSRKPGNLSRENQDWKYDEEDEKDPLWE